jgi:hypothetical protein
MPKWKLLAGRGGTKLRVTIRDSETDDAVDLTIKTVQLRYKISGGALQERAMTVLDQAANKGQAEYLFLSSDMTDGAEMKVEFRLQHGLADQLTTVNTVYLKIKIPMS